MVLPVYANTSLGGDSRLYGLLVSCVGLGSFVGAINSARKTHITHKSLTRGGAFLGLSLLGVAVAPTVPPAVVALGLLGATSTSLLIGIQSRLQVKIPNVMSGRILALYSVAFAGSKPVGGFLAGWTTELTGPRFVFAACGVVIGGMFLLAFRQSRRPMRPVSNAG